MPAHDLEFLILNYRRITPAGYTLLQRLAVERASSTVISQVARGVSARIVAANPVLAAAPDCAGAVAGAG